MRQIKCIIENGTKFLVGQLIEESEPIITHIEEFYDECGFGYAIMSGEEEIKVLYKNSYNKIVLEYYEDLENEDKMAFSSTNEFDDVIGSYESFEIDNRKYSIGQLINGLKIETIQKIECEYGFYYTCRDSIGKAVVVIADTM